MNNIGNTPRPLTAVHNDIDTELVDDTGPRVEGPAAAWDTSKPWALDGTDWRPPAPDEAPAPWWPLSEGSDSPDERATPEPDRADARRSSSRAEQHRFRSDVIEGLARFGFLTTPQIAAWTGLRVSTEAVEKRLQRMAAQGLLEKRAVRRKHAPRIRCWTLAQKGVTSAPGRPSYVEKIGSSTARHHLIAAQVAIQLHLTGHQVTTERELRNEEIEHRDRHGYRLRNSRTGGRRIRIMPNGDSVRYREKDPIKKWHGAWMPRHRPDLRLLAPEATNPEPGAPVAAEAWEIELNRKTTERLERKLAWYSATPHYSTVVYLCATEAIAASVKRAAQQAAPNLDLRTAVLPHEFMEASISSRVPPGTTLPAELVAGLLATPERDGQRATGRVA